MVYEAPSTVAPRTILFATCLNAMPSGHVAGGSAAGGVSAGGSTLEGGRSPSGVEEEHAQVATKRRNGNLGDRAAIARGGSKNRAPRAHRTAGRRSNTSSRAGERSEIGRRRECGVQIRTGPCSTWRRSGRA